MWVFSKGRGRRMIETFKEYEDKAMRTSNGLNNNQMIYNAILGLNGESGELADLLKKHLFQGHTFDRNKLIEELGDVMCYCALLAKGLNIELDEVADLNIMKLSTRYPKGFEKERSVNRKE